MECRMCGFKWTEEESRCPVCGTPIQSQSAFGGLQLKRDEEQATSKGEETESFGEKVQNRNMREGAERFQGDARSSSDDEKWRTFSDSGWGANHEQNDMSYIDQEKFSLEDDIIITEHVGKEAKQWDQNRIVVSIILFLITTFIVMTVTGAASYMSYLRNPSAYEVADAKIILNVRQYSSRRKNRLEARYVMVKYSYSGGDALEYIKRGYSDHEGDIVPVYINSMGIARRMGFVGTDFVLAIVIYSVVGRIIIKYLKGDKIFKY